MAGALHHAPPATPSGVLFRHPALIWLVAGSSLVLAALAAVDHGSLLLSLDRPALKWVVDHRTPGLEIVFRSFSRLGSNLVVFPVFAVLVALAPRRCRPLAAALALAVLARPVLEFTVKEIVGRDRPDLARLVDGTGPSHPSGHVLAAVTLWGLLPPLVALVTDRRWLWWGASAISAVLIGGIAASRVYLGVHWPTDIVQGLLMGWLYLTALEAIFLYHHRHRPCGLGPLDA